MVRKVLHLSITFTDLKRSGAVGDPASLGVYALLIGNSDRKYKPYLDASNREAQSVLKVAPRFWNGAISHRYSVPELWADFLFMAPPFLAYYAVSTNNPSLLRETVKQATLYRQILLHNTTEKYHGLWEHIIGEKPNSGDRGLWSTGNGWAAAGMTRVLATVMKWPTSAGWRTDIELLKGYIKEILDGAMAVDVGHVSKSSLKMGSMFCGMRLRMKTVLLTVSTVDGQWSSSELPQ